MKGWIILSSFSSTSTPFFLWWRRGEGGWPEPAELNQGSGWLYTFCIFKHTVIWQFAYFFKSLPEISHLPNFCLCVLLVDGAVDGEKNLEKKTREVADIGVYQFSWNFLQRGCDTTMNSLTSLVFFSRLFWPSKVSSTTNSHVLNVVTYVGNMKRKKNGTAFGAGNLWVILTSQSFL